MIVLSQPTTGKFSTRYQVFRASGAAYAAASFGSLASLADNDNVTIPDIYARISSKAPAADQAQMKPYTNAIPGTRVTYAMVPIPGGEFLMGSPESEPGRKPDEGPQHKVRVEPFWMGQCEVTWNEYELFMYPDEERRTRATVASDESGDKLADAVTHPSKPYVEMSFGMGKDGFPAISMTHHAANKYLPVAQRQDRPFLPPPDRGGMGICLPRRHDHHLFLGRRCLQAARLCLVRAEQRFQVPEGGQEETQSLGPVRHVRQRDRMGARPI